MMHLPRICLSLVLLLMCQSQLKSQSNTYEVTTLVTINSPTGLEDLAIVGGDYLFTPSGQSGTVYRIHKTTGSNSIVMSGLFFPQGGSSDNAGNYYVSNFNTGNITRYSPSGNRSTFAGLPIGPTGSVVGPGNDTLYAVNYYNNTIYKISLADSSVTTFASGNGLNGPDGMAFDNNNTLYVANFNNNRIHKVDKSGQVSLFATLPGANTGYIDILGEWMFVAGHNSHRIYRVNLQTAAIDTIAGTGAVGSQDGSGDTATFSRPNGLAVDRDSGKIYVMDALTRSLRVISPGATSINDHDQSALNGFRLLPNYPNPFNPSTTIEFELPAAALVTLEIYDIVGRHVETLYRESLPSGTHKFDWNATDAAGNSLASGVYFYRFRAREFVQTRRMLLIR